MNRRNFFKTLFGTAAAVVAGVPAVKSVPVPAVCRFSTAEMTRQGLRFFAYEQVGITVSNPAAIARVTFTS